MEIYDSLLKAVHDEYDTLRVLKKSAWGEVSLVRHRESGTRYIFRHFEGSSEVYQLLLGLSCRNLPQIMEVGEKDGRTALLEEYVQGDTLGEILEGGVLTTGQVKQIGRQLCSALWVLHSRGIVHRDVKPDNVILRGSEAVLIDFDASRIHKTAISEDTKILGTTGFAAPEQYGLSQSVGRQRYLCAGCTAQYHADGRAPFKEACRRRMGRSCSADKGKPGEKIQKYPSSDGGIIIGENHEQEMCEMRASASGGRFFLSTLHGNSSGKRGDQGAEAVEKEGFCDWSSTGVSGRCGLCFFFVP